MPELPEVEAARRAIEEHCVGKKIKRALVADDPKVIDAVSPSDFEASLLGKTIVAAHRKGKNMWLQLDSPPFPTFQFGMTGAIYIKGVAVTKYKRQLRGEQAPFLSAYLENYTLHSNHIQWENPAYMPPNPPPVPQPLDNYHLVEADLEDFLERSAVADTDEWPSKYSKVFMELDDGLELSFTDKRRFARVRLLKNPISVPPICELGPDALFEPMTTDEFFNSLSKKKIGIKALLLDQSFISGIGNWIADEVLYQARIHPMQNAASISKESCAALHKCIKEVIEKAVEVGADSSQFPSYWIFHSRERKPGKAFVDGKKIEFINAGGRTSAFVPELQRLTGNQAAIAPVKQPKITKKNKDEDGGDDDDDGPEESEIEDAARCVESKGKNTTKRGGKKPHLKGKNKANDVDSAAAAAAADDDEEEQQQHIRGKKPPAKTKSKEINRDDGDQMKKSRGKRPPTKRKSRDDERDNTSDNDDDDDKKDQKKAIKGKQSNVEKTSRKKVKTSQSGKQLKKKAK